MDTSSRSSSPISIELKRKSKYHRVAWTTAMLREFHNDLVLLLAAAGYEGSYSVVQAGLPMKGGAHLKGLTVGCPGSRWVEIYAQYGDNGTRDTWRIFFPYEDTAEDQQKLKTALQNLAERKNSLRPEPAVTPIPANDTQTAAPEKTPTESPVKGFVDSEVNMSLLLLAVYEKAGENLVFRKSLVSEVLTMEFQFPRKGTGPIHRALQSRSFLEARGDQYHMTPKAQEVIGQPAASPVVAESLAKQEPESVSVAVEGVLDKLVLLQEQASRYDSLGAEMAALETQKQALLAQVEDIDGKLKSLQAEQQATLSARATIEQISKMLDQSRS